MLRYKSVNSFSELCPAKPACPVADEPELAGRRPRQACVPGCRRIGTCRKASPPSLHARLQTNRNLQEGVPAKPCMPGCRRIGTCRKASPPSLCARLQTNRNLQEGVPAKPCVSVADCSESSVLRSCTLGPYVPLRRTPSESGSAIRHVGLRRRDASPEPAGLQPDTQGFGAGTPSLGRRVCSRTCWA